ncbi:MAG TPA: hypothetical protein VJN71_01475 [Nitrososphaerales archaeon]|nr:hypothetical protein [Nitrososphaerales archaeon]
MPSAVLNGCFDKSVMAMGTNNYLGADDMCSGLARVWAPVNYRSRSVAIRTSPPTVTTSTTIIAKSLLVFIVSYTD